MTGVGEICRLTGIGLMIDPESAGIDQFASIIFQVLPSTKIN
jgi:hypothetical protein